MFDLVGRFIPHSSQSTYREPCSDFYKLNLPFPNQLKVRDHPDKSVEIDHVNDSLSHLLSKIKTDNQLSNILNGPTLPFFISKTSIPDIGERLEKIDFPSLSNSFCKAFPKSHFKAIIQDDLQLVERLHPYPSTRYDLFLDHISRSSVVGYYFPLAFNQFSISSQRSCMNSLPTHIPVCLSGPIEVSSVLTSYPSILFDKTSYSPILCLSGVAHYDERLIACFKSYGPHLEFWIISNCLLPGVEQVSEQWSGGLTIYHPI